ncbi:glucokinase [Desulfoplanes formicivorans]|uniref:Glucokinase n=1 Tax=Desulfoplanes formicivorans TaxID=1592317 RepID=A0A194AJJ4_9BACT|nr:glucokinase [Desulfoplanes formicivorans]GAU09226.1 glucokinase [Desulfoplanes formicivorans]
MQPTPCILAADIGGTFSRFGWFAIRNGCLECIEHLRLRTADSACFRDMLRHVSTSGPEGDIRLAAFAVAGAVEPGGGVHPPNIPWDMHRDMIAAYFPRHILLNDFQAQAFGCQTPLADHAMSIQPGVPDPDGVLAVLGAGTGLGHCLLVPDGHGGHVAIASEAGHAAFPLYGPHEADYLDFLRAQTGQDYPVGDMIVSGSGLSMLHAFLNGPLLSPAEVARHFHRFPNTLEWFARFYGRACRQYCLNVLPTRGLFISGGLAAKHPEMIAHPAFIAEFLHVMNYRDFLKNIPIVLNRDEDMGLWGAAECARQQLHKEGNS